MENFEVGLLVDYLVACSVEKLVEMMAALMAYP